MKCDFVDTALRDLEAPAAERAALPWQFLCVDEYQEFCTVGLGDRGDDATFNIIGETRTIGIISTQGHSEIISKAGNETHARPIYNSLTNKIYFAVDDEVSARIISEEIGDREVVEISRNYSSMPGQRSSVHQQRRRKRYIEPSDIKLLPRFTAIIRRSDARWRKAWCPPLDDNGNSFKP